MGGITLGSGCLALASYWCY